MDLQTAFNKIWQAFIVEEAPQSLNNSDGACSYRTFNPEGNVISRCAIGVCIPDDKYYPAIEGMSIFDLQTQWESFYDIFDTDIDVDALAHLQRAHDFHFNVNYDDLRQHVLREVADKYGLDVPETVK